MLKTPSVSPLRFPTYLSMVEGSIGTRMFSRGYARVNGKKTEILNKGELSCAWFVSSVLVTFGYIRSSHSVVESTVHDLIASGWVSIKKPRLGAIIIWEKNGNGHAHIGFYIGNNECISNSTVRGVPAKHHWKKWDSGDGTERKIADILWRPGIDKT